MSAHRIYCYNMQRPTVEEYLRNLGAPISHDVPHGVDVAEQLRGLDHITFIVIDNHRWSVPRPMWEAIIADGALVIHVDDQYVRDRIERVHVRHYEPSINNGGTDMTQEQVNKAFSPCGS